MSKRKNKPARGGRTSKPARDRPAQDRPADRPAGAIPDAPPMADRSRPMWPFWLVLGLFALWLAVLTWLAFHSGRYTPGG